MEVKCLLETVCSNSMAHLDTKEQNPTPEDTTSPSPCRATVEGFAATDSSITRACSVLTSSKWKQN